MPLQAVYLRHIFINGLLVTPLEVCSAVQIKMALQFYMTDHTDLKKKKIG